MLALRQLSKSRLTGVQAEVFSADAGNVQAVVKLTRTNTDYAKRAFVAMVLARHFLFTIPSRRQPVADPGSLAHEQRVLRILNDAKATRSCTEL